jgi:ABC-type Fe3+-hydroxamate transport system substrate-binding protein
MRWITCCACGALCLLLSACATSSAGYIEDAKTFAVTKGSIVSISGLTAESPRRFSDGVAVTVNKPGGQVVIKLGQQTQTIPVSPGWVLIFGTKEDYVLQPYQPPEPAAEPEKDEAPKKDATPEKT